MSAKDPNKLQRDKARREAGDRHFLDRKLAAWHRYAAKPENKKKIRARNKIKHLCRIGKVKRGACEVCGAPNTHAHHDDYSKPLEVRWLCSTCHGQEHKIAAE